MKKFPNRINWKIPVKIPGTRRWEHQHQPTLTPPPCPHPGKLCSAVSAWLLALLPFPESPWLAENPGPLHFQLLALCCLPHGAGTWSIMKLLCHVLPTGSAAQHNIPQKKNSLHLSLQFTKDSSLHGQLCNWGFFGPVIPFLGLYPTELKAPI